VKQHAHLKNVYAIALLFWGSAIPATGWSHWEGFEAADPATPAALLIFDSAVTRYTALNAGPLPWRAIFEGDSGTVDGTSGTVAGADAPANHARAAQQTNATTQQ
jgi:hypothetical protein